MNLNLIGIIIILAILIIIVIMPVKKPSTIEEKHELTDYVTKQGGTEPAFQNEYWDKKKCRNLC